jgi:NhaP-type Na+/H+ or K+/H+ antiporter
LTGASSKPKIGVILGVIGGCIVILLLGALLFIMYKHRHKGDKREVYVDVAGLFSFYLLN